MFISKIVCIFFVNRRREERELSIFIILTFFFLKSESLKAGDVTSEPDISLLNLASHDQFLVLASDGLWDVMKNEEVVAFVLRRVERQMGEWEVSEGRGRISL